MCACVSVCVYKKGKRKEKKGIEEKEGGGDKNLCIFQ